jgi:hypothetical protein
MKVKVADRVTGVFRGSARRWAVLGFGALIVVVLTGASFVFQSGSLTIISGSGLPITRALTQSLLYHEDFESDDGDWYPVTDTGFEAPYCVYEGKKLKINAQGSDNSFGYWESPRLTVYEGQLHRAIFKVSSFTNTDTEVPTFRMRVTAIDPSDVRYQSVAMLVVNSTGNANYAPTEDSPEYYEVYFRAPDNTEKVRLEFDLLSFDGVNDDPTVSVRLEEVWLELLN